MLLLIFWSFLSFIFWHLYFIISIHFTMTKILLFLWVFHTFQHAIFWTIVWFFHKILINHSLIIIVKYLKGIMFINLIINLLYTGFIIFLFYCWYVNVIHILQVQKIRNYWLKIIILLLNFIIRSNSHLFAIFIEVIRCWFLRWINQKFELLHSNLELISSINSTFQWTFSSSH